MMSLIKKTGGVLVLASVTFLLLELVLRCLPVELQSSEYRVDPKLGWRLNPHFPVPASGGIELLNAEGWRGPLAAKQKSKLRVACLGDSCTFGVFIKKSSDTYPGQLRTILEKKYQVPAEILDFGLNGYNTLQGVELLRSDAARVKPDIVTLYYGWNERTRVVGYFNYEERIHFLNSIYFKSKVVRLLYLLTDGWIQNLRYSRKLNRLFGERMRKHPLSLEQVRKNLLEAVRLSREKNITPVFMTSPWGGGDLSEQRRRYAALSAAQRRGLSPVDLVYSLHNIDEYNQLVREVALQEGIALVDLADLFEKIPEAEQGPYFYPDDRMHPSELGCRWIAEVLAPEIVKIQQARSKPPVLPLGAV